MNDRRIETLSRDYGLSSDVLRECCGLFDDHGIPVPVRTRKSSRAGRIVMVSTHGYWGDPPPAGVPDTGGQTYYVLEVAKAWARQGRRVIIVARHFEPYPRVEQFARNLWLVRIRGGGDGFVRKEDIYPLVPAMAEQTMAVAALFGAHAVVGHYADGMVCALEVGERLALPVVVVPHSLGINKILNLGLDPSDPAVWFDEQYNFRIREDLELAALRGADFEIANTLREPDVLREYYELELPHAVMPAGAGAAFFDATADPHPEVLDKYGLSPGNYLLYFGRFSRAKNVPGVVRLLGEARRMDPNIMQGMRLVLVGGSPESPLPEEASVEEETGQAMNDYGISAADVIRLPSQPWEVLAVLARHCLSYVGMQFVEPFGMGVAESMAASAPTVISKEAGIAKWVENGRDALVVDPRDPLEAARRLIDSMKESGTLERIASNGHRLARETFRWKAISEHQGDILDALCAKGPRVRGRAYHRTTFAWRGDFPDAKPQHERTARALLPHVVEAAEKMQREKRRAIAVFAGESGAGKTEVAEYLRYLLRGEGMRGVTIPGDAFFRLTPQANHRARLDAHTQGRLEEYLGPREVDLERLDAVLGEAASLDAGEVNVSCECRLLGSRRYSDAPISLHGAQVVLVDLTYGLALANVTLKVFLESDYRARIAALEKRNLARDPDQDFAFIRRVLEIEHGIIQSMREAADIIVTADYEIRPRWLPTNPTSK